MKIMQNMKKKAQNAKCATYATFNICKNAIMHNMQKAKTA